MSSSSVEYVRDTLHNKDMLFIALTETWLQNHKDAEVQVANYTVFRSDRNRKKKRRGRNSGGVAMYIRNDLAASTETILRLSDGSNDALGVYIKELNLVAIVLYRPPAAQSDERENLNLGFGKIIQEVADKLNCLPAPMPNIVVMGDFNLPKSKWPHCIPKPGATPLERNILLLLEDLSHQFFLKQIIEKPTHKAGNTLDLLFTNNPSLFLNHEVFPATPISSHSLVEFNTLLNYEDMSQNEIPHSQNPFDLVNLLSADTKWPEMKAYLGTTDWHTIFENLNPEEMMSVFLEKCAGAATRFAPKRTSKKKSSKPLIPRHRRVLMRRRNKYRKRLQKATHEARKSALKSKLIQIERCLQESYNSQAVHDENKAVEAIKENPKFFYSYAKKRLKTQSGVGPLMDKQGNATHDPEKMVELLSDQFLSAFSSPMSLPLNMSTPPEPSISDIQFTPKMIAEAINEVKINSAPGPDRFPAILLKNCRDELALPLCLIWRASLDSGIIPQITKTSVITPIFKDGDKLKPKNYRPVALTSHLIKTFEKVLRNAIVKHIEDNNLLNPNQHGFRSGHSCLSQLVHHYDQITQHMEDGKNIDVIYLDFAKAFDKLDFTITLQKVYDLGITGKIHRWIMNFLTGREQAVAVNGVKSCNQGVLSGVPQGSVIGPILFLILLGDID